MQSHACHVRRVATFAMPLYLAVGAASFQKSMASVSYTVDGSVSVVVDAPAIDGHVENSAPLTESSPGSYAAATQGGETVNIPVAVPIWYVGPPLWVSGTGAGTATAKANIVASTSGLLATLQVDTQVSEPTPSNSVIPINVSTAASATLSFTVSSISRYNLTSNIGVAGSVSLVGTLASWGGTALLKPGITYQLSVKNGFQSAYAPASDSSSALLTITTLSPLKVFAAGVDWTNGSDQSLRGVNGALGASNFYNTLTGLPNFAGDDTSVDLSLDSTELGARNLQSIQDKFQSWAANLKPGDTAVVYFSSHGLSDNSDGQGHALPPNAVGVLGLNDERDGETSLTESTLGELLNKVPSQTRVVVVIDACYAGIFAGLAGDNRELLLSSDLEGTSLFGGNAGLFTQDLDNAISLGNVDLTNLPNGFNYYLAQQLLGKDFPEESLFGGGTGTFTGLSPIVITGNDFTGDLLGPALPIPESRSTFGLASVIALCMARVRRRGPAAI